MRTVKTEHEIRWMPPLKAFATLNSHGWLIIDRKTWEVVNIHHYSDYGVTLETFTIEKDGETKEIYTQDEGETFIWDIE